MKTILLSTGEAKTMNFEEVKEQFEPMLFKHMKVANGKFVFNQVEEEDFMQELQIELWRAYEQYDSATGNCFTTYLHYKLQKGVRNATFSRYSLKNRNNGLVSMNASRGDDDLKLEDMFASDENTSDNITLKELTAIIRRNVSEAEEDALISLLNKDEFSVNDYAAKHNITRQAANQRIVKLRNKLRSIIAQEYLEIV